VLLWGLGENCFEVVEVDWLVGGWGEKFMGVWGECDSFYWLGVIVEGD
jgi:hypothetical protein